MTAAAVGEHCTVHLAGECTGVHFGRQILRAECDPATRQPLLHALDIHERHAHEQIRRQTVAALGHITRKCVDLRGVAIHFPVACDQHASAHRLPLALQIIQITPRRQRRARCRQGGSRSPRLPPHPCLPPSRATAARYRRAAIIRDLPHQASSRLRVRRW